VFARKEKKWDKLFQNADFSRKKRGNVFKINIEKGFFCGFFRILGTKQGNIRIKFLQ
jgi:hypothetical protein